MAKTSAYLVVLSGQGDLEIKIVDKETFDWINSEPVFKKGQNSVEEKVPLSQVAARRRAYGKSSDVDMEHICVSRGSPDNDRALCCFTILEYSQVDSVKAAIAQIKKKGHKLVDEYHGGIY